MPDPNKQVESIVQFLSNNGLRGPASFLLEVGQPFLFIGGQLLWVLQPALSLIWSAQQIRQVAELLEDKTAVQALAQQLAGEETNP